jgi:hypothetical protein
MVRILKKTYIRYIFEQEERLLSDPFFDPISTTLLYHPRYNHKDFDEELTNMLSTFGIKDTDIRYVGSNWESYVNKLDIIELKILSKKYEKQGAPPIYKYNKMINNE